MSFVTLSTRTLAAAARGLADVRLFEGLMRSSDAGDDVKSDNRSDSARLEVSDSGGCCRVGSIQFGAI